MYSFCSSLDKTTFNFFDGIINFFLVLQQMGGINKHLKVIKLTYKLRNLKNKNNKINFVQKQHASQNFFRGNVCSHYIDQNGVTVSLKDLCAHMNVNLMI